MKEYDVNVILPYETLSTTDRVTILALYCNACQAYLRTPFWNASFREGVSAPKQVAIEHQFINGGAHYSQLVDTGKRFRPHKKVNSEPRCI